MRGLALARAALAAAMLALAPASLAADPSPAPPPAPALSAAAELDGSISEVLRRPEYAWRMPRETTADAPELKSGLIANFLRELGRALGRGFKWVADRLEQFWRWLRDLLDPGESREDGEPTSLNWQGSIRLMLFTLLAVTCSVLGVTLYRLLTAKRRPAAVVAAPVAARPDVADESVTADRLPSDEWLAMARDLLARGEFRLAMRAVFLASLAALAHGGRLTLAAHKSNRDYACELERRARDRAAAVAAFRDGVCSLERVWYGRHAATAELADAFLHDSERILSELEPPARPSSAPP